MKARNVVIAATSEVVISRSDIEDNEINDAIRYMNRMMESFKSRGYDIGYTEITDPDEDLTVSDTALLGIIKNLAVKLQPQYSSPGDGINPLIAFSANRHFVSIENNAINEYTPMLYPDTLPVGSGNYQGAYAREFYTNNTTDQGYYIGEEDNND